jgi:hypothetical protein
MNAVAVRLQAGDVIEVKVAGEWVSAMVLLANSDTVIFDLNDGGMPLVAHTDEMGEVRVFDGQSV